MEEAPKVLRFYRDWIADAPDELMTIVVHRKAPPLPFVPPELHGKPVVAVVVLLRGAGRGGRGGRRAAQGSSARRSLDVCEPKPYLAHQAMFDPSFPHGWWYYFRSCDVAELTDDVIDIAVEHVAADPLPADGLPDLADGRGGRTGRRGRDRLQRPHAGLHLQHQRHHGDGRRLRRGAGVGRGASGRRSSRTTRACT